MKRHRDEHGTYLNIRTTKISMELLTKKIWESLPKNTIGAVEGIKNGWAKVRTHGYLQADLVTIARMV